MQTSLPWKSTWDTDLMNAVVAVICIPSKCPFVDSIDWTLSRFEKIVRIKIFWGTVTSWLKTCTVSDVVQVTQPLNVYIHHLSNNMTDTCMDDHVYEAQAVALYPPRPDAIMTLLHAPEFLPGTQTLLYSLKVSLGQSQRTMTFSNWCKCGILIITTVRKTTNKALHVIIVRTRKIFRWNKDIHPRWWF